MVTIYSYRYQAEIPCELNCTDPQKLELKSTFGRSVFFCYWTNSPESDNLFSSIEQIIIKSKFV